MHDLDGSRPPLDRWSQEAAEAALRALVRDRRHIGPDEAWQRLQRLSVSQRDWVLARVQAWEIEVEPTVERLFNLIGRRLADRVW